MDRDKDHETEDGGLPSSRGGSGGGAAEAMHPEDPDERERTSWDHESRSGEDREAIQEDLMVEEALQEDIRELERQANELERERARRHSLS